MAPHYAVPAHDDLNRFALDLRALRNRSGHRFLHALSVKTGIADDILTAIFDGRRLPREQVLRKIVIVCNGELHSWLHRRELLEDALIRTSMETAKATAGRANGVSA